MLKNFFAAIDRNAANLVDRLCDRRTPFERAVQAGTSLVTFAVGTVAQVIAMGEASSAVDFDHLDFEKRITRLEADSRSDGHMLREHAARSDGLAAKVEGLEERLDAALDSHGRDLVILEEFAEAQLAANQIAERAIRGIDARLGTLEERAGLTSAPGNG